MYDNTVSVRGGSCDQGWQNAFNSGLPFRRDFFYFTCVFIKAIGTCMQIFRRFYRKKTEVFSFENLVQCFCARLYIEGYAFFQDKITGLYGRRL